MMFYTENERAGPGDESTKAWSMLTCTPIGTVTAEIRVLLHYCNVNADGAFPWVPLTSILLFICHDSST